MSNNCLLIVSVFLLLCLCNYIVHLFNFLWYTWQNLIFSYLFTLQRLLVVLYCFTFHEKLATLYKLKRKRYIHQRANSTDMKWKFWLKSEIINVFFLLYFIIFYFFFYFFFSSFSCFSFMKIIALVMKEFFPFEWLFLEIRRNIQHKLPKKIGY